MFMKVMLCENADWLLSEEAFSIYASCMYHPTYKDYKGQMDDLLCDPSTKVFVYEDQGRKTGMIILKFSDAAAEIIGIAVSVDARRKGIGKQLIRRVMELDDLECVKAQTDDDSIGFYRKCGFSEEKIVIEYPDGPAVRYNCVLHKQTTSDLTRWIVNNKEIVKYFYEDVVSKNLIDEAAHFLSAEDVEEMCQHLIAVRNTYPDYTMSITRQFEDGEYVVSEFVMRGTHSGEFLGITPTNKTIEIKGVNIDKIVDGKITEHSGVANTFEAFWENGLIKSV